MAQQTFSVGNAPRVNITQVQGDLKVRTWRERSISVETDGSVSDLQQEGNTLSIVDCDSDLSLIVPDDTAIKVSNVDGDALVEGVRRVALDDISGDVVLKNIAGDAGLENIGEAVELTNLGGDLVVLNTPVLRIRHSVGGDAKIKQVGVVEIETIGGDFVLEQAEMVVVSTLGGDLSVRDVQAALRCGVVGGDVNVAASPSTEVMLGNVGGDLSLSGAANVQIGNTGGDSVLRGVQGDLEIGNVGGDLNLEGVQGHLQIGRVSGDANFKGLHSGVEVGGISGDLALHSMFASDTLSRLNVGGDAVVVVPDNANLSIAARVGGDISGRSVVVSRSGKMINLVYGTGAAHLELNVGGDLALKGPGNPRSSSSSSGTNEGSSWSDFGRDMSNLGRELGKMGQDLSRQIASAFSEAGWKGGASIADELSRKSEEIARRAQQQAEQHARQAQRQAEQQSQQAQEQARQAQRQAEQAARVNIRFNDREWRLDPERLERIREQARRATEEGIAGAFEAVERAMNNLHIPKPPKPPKPPKSPTPPYGSVPPVPPVPPSPVTPVSPMQQQSQQESSSQNMDADVDVDVDVDADVDGETPQSSPVDIEKEREAILRMIAEGRVTPEEGDLLLEALGG